MLRCFPVKRRGTAFLVSYPHRYQHYRGPTEDQQFVKARSDIFHAEYRGKVFVLNAHNQYQWRTKFLFPRPKQRNVRGGGIPSERRAGTQVDEEM